jgi:hypothetical protein
MSKVHSPLFPARKTMSTPTIHAINGPPAIEIFSLCWCVRSAHHHRPNKYVFTWSYKIPTLSCLYLILTGSGVADNDTNFKSSPMHNLVFDRAVFNFLVGGYLLKDAHKTKYWTLLLQRLSPLSYQSSHHHINRFQPSNFLPYWFFHLVLECAKFW